MSKVYVCRNWFPEILDTVRPLHEIRVWEEDCTPPKDVLLTEVRDINGLLCFGSDRIDAEIIKAAPKLKVISNFGAGYNNIDVAEATRHGIAVGNTPHVLTETTADFIFALLLASARRIVEANAFTRQGKWRRGQWGLSSVNVHHATLGIVGLGRIGTQVAKRARGFNMRVLYYDTIRKVDIESILGVERAPDLHSLLSQSDFISLNAPLTEETRHMIGAHEFAVMKPTAMLINVSRGAVIDQAALYEALKSHQILSAAVDGTEVEPIPLDDPLLTLDNIIITPHIGADPPSTKKKGVAMAVEQLLAGLRGYKLPYCVNPLVYDRPSEGL